MFVLRLVALLGAAISVAASPVPGPARPAPPKPVTRGAILCAVPLIRMLCRKDAGEIMVMTPIGMARGLQTSSDSTRFVVKYASAARWGLPTQETIWAIPGNNINQLPPVCPQNGVAASAYSEDCLHLIIYTPVPSPALLPKVPVLVWIHGGSFLVGSATGAGLDGAALAKSTGSIVVVVQYRLGTLGLIPPSIMNANSNLAVRDVISALQFMRPVISSFGGDINQITVAGQSSGGQMIRALLASPSANNLFKYASIHSDPMDYGFYKPATITTLQSYLYKNASSTMAACNDIACLRAVPVSEVLNAQNTLLGQITNLDPATSGGSPLRPSHDGQLLQYTLTGNSFPPVLKPVLVMTVKDEAGSTMTDQYGNPVPDYYVDPTIQGFYGPTRGNALVNSGNYAANAYASQAGVASGDEARAALVQLFTDALWRCPSWTFSRTWASKGGNVFTGVFQHGATYPSNQGISYCNGHVCHEDDIYILFGTTPNATPAQTALTQEIQARYSSFMRTGVPNPSSSSYATWAQSGTSDVAALKLGGTGTQPAEACDPSFWGNAVQYDYQIYGL